LIQLEQAFWQCVESDTAPSADGSDSADVALRALYPHDTGAVVDLRGDLVMSAVLSDLVAVREASARQIEREQELKQRIQQRMGGASKALFDAGEVTWKRSKDSSAVDVERLQQEHPAVVAPFIKPRPGSRRFLVNV
jgi:predicted phage-related endonuclease